jgi:macrolide-specific efflux system membrane fusion protein
VCIPALTGCTGGDDPGPTVVTAKRGSVVSRVVADGQVEAHEQLALAFEGSGRVTHVFVDEGDKVSRGQVLAQLDDRSQRVHLDSAVADRDAAESTFQATRRGLTPVELADLRRQTDAARVDVRSARRDLDSARRVGNAQIARARGAIQRAGVSGAKADVRSSRGRVRQAESRLAGLERQYRRSGPDTLLTTQLTASEAAIGSANEAVGRAKSALRVARHARADAVDDLRVTKADANRDRTGAQSSVSSAKAELARVDSQNNVEAQVKGRDVDAAEAGVRQADSAVSDARKAIHDRLLRAPAAGVVGKIDVKAGELASGSGPRPAGPSGGAPSPAPAGLPRTLQRPVQAPSASSAAAAAGAGAAPSGGSGVITLAETGQMQVEAQVSEFDAGSLRTGDQAMVEVDAFPGRRIGATITSIDPIEDTQAGVVTYTVTLVLSDPPKGLRNGMSATVNIELARADDVVTVPRSAVRSPEGLTPNVIVVGTDGREEARKVTTGIQSGDRIEITSGLEEGDHILDTVSAPVERSRS